MFVEAGRREWVSGVILDVYDDFDEVRVQIGHRKDGEITEEGLFDFCLGDEASEIPFDREWCRCQREERRW